jgi:hypothetical protein
MMRPNKLEHLSLETLSSRVLEFEGKPNWRTFQTLPSWGKLLVLPANVRLYWKGIARNKHSSLFGLIFCNEAKNFFSNQAAAHNVRLDGDVILQQSDVLHWQAEGAGSMEELRSVCSCACDTCIVNPFGKGPRKTEADSVDNLIEMNEHGRSSTTMR